MNSNTIRHGLGIARFVERIELRDFDARLEDDYLTVWVNVDMATATQWNAYKDEEAVLRKLLAQAEKENKPDTDPQIVEQAIAQVKAQVKVLEDLAIPFYAGLWDLTVEDARALFTANQALFTWCVEQSWEHLNKYRSGRPKA